MADKSAIATTSREATQIIVANAITLFIAATAVLLRFITRRNILHFIGKEDWCILIALLFSTCTTIGVIIRQEVPAKGLMNIPSQLIIFKEAYFFASLAYNIAQTFTKVSILFLYLRIFVDSKIQIICYIQLFIVITYQIGILTLKITQCFPTATIWDPTITGVCFSRTYSGFVNAGFNIATDVMIILLPLCVIKSLVKLPRRQKWGLYCIFALGFLVCGISVVRLVALKSINLSDSTANRTTFLIWSVIELNTAITCACLTTLKPLIARYFPNLLSSTKAHTPPANRNEPSSQWNIYHNSNRDMILRERGRKVDPEESWLDCGPTPLDDVEIGDANRGRRTGHETPNESLSVPQSGHTWGHSRKTSSRRNGIEDLKMDKFKMQAVETRGLS